MGSGNRALVYANWLRQQRSVITEDNDDREGPTVYDDSFAGFPHFIKRFLPAAHLQVRGDPQLRMFEQDNPRTFRQIVAETAYRMSKLSARDLGSVKDVAKVDHGTERLQPSGMRESTLSEDEDLEGMTGHEEPDGDEGPVVVAHVSGRHRGFRWPVRVFSEEEGKYIIKVGPHLEIAPSRAAAIGTLLQFGLDTETALDLMKKAGIESVATHTSPAYSPAEADPHCP